MFDGFSFKASITCVIGCQANFSILVPQYTSLYMTLSILVLLWVLTRLLLHWYMWLASLLFIAGSFGSVMIHSFCLNSRICQEVIDEHFSKMFVCMSSNVWRLTLFGERSPVFLLFVTSRIVPSSGLIMCLNRVRLSFLSVIISPIVFIFLRLWVLCSILCSLLSFTAYFLYVRICWAI
jgi:hypothetical protein